MAYGLTSHRYPGANALRRHRSLRIEQLENRSLLATATLDTFFGESGLVETSVHLEQGTIDYPHQLVQQADGKLLALGLAVSSTHLPMIARLMPDGTRDSSFGVNGVALLPSDGGGSVSSIAVQLDGKILVGGYDNGPYLARLTDAGVLDIGFGNSGYLRSVYHVGQIDQIIVQSDGKLLVGGDGWDGDFVVTRLLPNGEVDPTYGHDGTGRFDRPQSVQVFEMALQPDGKLVAAGMYTSAGHDTLVVTRFTVNGLVDESFGQAGLHEIVVGPHHNQVYLTDTFDLAIGPDGRIAVVGTAGGDSNLQAVAKLVVLTKDGLPETTFSGDGIEHLSLGSHTVSGGVGILGDGSVLVAGQHGPHSGASSHFLAKLTSQGAFDAAWGVGGYISTDFSASFDSPRDLVIGANGNVLTLVETWSEDNSNDLMIAKWLPSGVLDSTFNGSGVSIINTARPLSAVSVDQLLSHPSGGMVLIGQSGFLWDQETTAVRYSADGQLDTTFGQAGIQRFSSKVLFGRGTVQPDGKLVMAVTEDFGNGWAVYPTRYLPDGTVDSTFTVQRTGIERPGNIHAQHVLAQADGKIVVIAIDYNYRGLNTLTRYLPDGQVDQSFGVEGVLELDGSYGQVLGAVEHEGTIYLLTGGLTYDPATGFSSAPMLLLRITQNGSADTTFGGTGAIVVDDPYSSDGKLLLDDQQRLVAVTATVAKRILLDGTPDISFGDDGIVVMPSGYSAPPALQGAALNSRGQLFVTRRFIYPHETDLPFVRLWTDGSIDSQFSAEASEIIRSHGFVDYPGLMVRGNEITVAGRSLNQLDSNFHLIRIQSDEFSAWQNPTNPLNVDNDPANAIVPLDVLLIINQLNLIGSRELTFEEQTSGNEIYYDVNGDNYLSAIDALIIINYLNADRLGPSPQSAEPLAGSGEFAAASGDADQLTLTDDPLAAAELSDEMVISLLWAVEDDRDRDRR